MKPVFENPAEAEKAFKEKYSVPPYLMMENAAKSLSEVILAEWDSGSADYEQVIFLCGKGNNGADGLVCARMLYGKIPVSVYCPVLPQTEDGKPQGEMCVKLKVPFLSEKKLSRELETPESKIIVDCVFGTGFHGELPSEWEKLFEKANLSQAFRIACDIPSALSFFADITVTMGTHKTSLYSDKAGQVCGRIIVSELGVSENIFTSPANKKHSIFLLEESDVKLPLRKNTNSHKGTYGHSLIIAGEKSGASILSAEAAKNFGSGLTSLFKTDYSNLKQFKISPELMITETIPKTTKAIQIGSGLGDTAKPEIENTINLFENWFTSSKNPACVIDADMFSYKDLDVLLKKLNKIENGRIVLTPHAKELALLSNRILKTDYTAAEALDNRISIGRELTRKLPNITVVMKGANTFIASKGNIYIHKGRCPALAKGGSGDVLAGMITSLLTQGYSAEDAAITAVWRHGTAALDYGSSAYNLTPGKLINLI